MGKKVKKKYYAIKKGIGVNNIIVDTWEECSKLVLGYNATYKSFFTKEDALSYIGALNKDIFKENEVREQINMNLPMSSLDKLKESKKKERNQKFERVKRGKKASVKELSVKIPTNLYYDFENKCAEMQLEKDDIIKNMIMEWLC